MAPLPTTHPPARIPPKPAKARNLPLTPEYLKARAERTSALGYPKPKWVEFCDIALRRGLVAYLYEAKHTDSKYVTLRHGGKSFKVRFSNHKPILAREIGNDCDFFVGVANRTVTTTGDAMRAAMAHFGMKI